MQRKMIGLLTGGLLAATSVGLMAPAANAAPQTLAPPGFYQVFGTDGTLAVQSQPSVGHVVGSVPEGAFVHVMCQVNTGGQDLGDGPFAQWQLSRTWDKIGTNAWVYDHFIATPPQDSSGWSLNTGCNGEQPS
jgi:hypothetical protein